MSNFFFVYRPFHLEYVRNIIATNYPEADNTIVNHCPVPVDRKWFARETRIIEPRSVQESLGQVRRLRTELDEKAGRGDAIDCFIPHTLALLPNYCYHRLARQYKNVNINVFYEGVILFYPYKHRYLSNWTYFLSRMAAGFLSGFIYTPQRQLIDLNDSRISKVFTPFTKLNVPSEKIVALGLDKKTYTPDEKVGLVLGIKLKIPAREFKKVIRAIYTRAQQCGIEKLYFKDHPAEKSPVYYEVAKEAGIELITINDNAPAEKIVADYRPKYILSSWSSSLLNLRSMLADDIFIYCCVSEAASSNSAMRQLVSVFDASNINVEYV